MTEKLVRFVTTEGKLRKMLRLTSIYAGGSGQDAWLVPKPYFSWDEDGLDAIVSAYSSSLLAYNSFREDYFEDFEVFGEGGAVFNTPLFLEFLEVVGEDTDGRIEVTLLGDEELAQKVEFRGAFEARAGLPSSAKVYDNVPRDFPERWSISDALLSPSGNEHSVFVNVPVEEIQRLIDAVNLEGIAGQYPVSVDGDSLRVEVGTWEDDEVDSIRGELEATSVNWGEEEPGRVQNYYGPGFTELFDKTLETTVELQLTNGATMGVVQRKENHKVRYALATAGGGD